MICDSHTHSVYSFDGHSTIEAMCESAISRGVDAFVLTEHHDIDGVMDGFYADYDAGGARQAIDAARRKYGDRVLVYLQGRGIDPEILDFCIRTNRLYERGYARAKRKSYGKNKERFKSQW